MKTIVQTVSKINKIKKALYLKWPFKPSRPQQTLFILGCQRSGTTMISRVFDNIIYAKVFGEYNKLANPPKGVRPLRLKNLATLAQQLDEFPQPMRVMKPIVDSQLAHEILNAVPNSRVLWIYRDYRAVAKSNIAKFGDYYGGQAHVEAMLKSEGEEDDWRADRISDDTQSTLRELVTDQLTPFEAACLFWYARNALFFEQHLAQSARVTLWKYEAFLASPLAMLNDLLRKLGYQAVGKRITSHVSNSVSHSAQPSDLNPKIMALCDNMQARLDEVYAQQNLSTPSEISREANR